MQPLFLVLLALSVVFATVPMLCFLGLVWWFDRYDREPIWLIGLTFVWGAVGAVILALIGSSILDFLLGMALGHQTTALVTPVVVAPLIEEPVKALILFLVVRSRHFDNTTDGFVYGAAAGLGFGMTENFLYFASVGATHDVGAWVGTVLVRTFYSAVMHATATSCVGAALGFGRFRNVLVKAMVVPFGFAVAMTIHALWNGFITVDAASGSGIGTVVDLVAFPLEFLTVFLVFQLCLLDERRTIRRELRDEAAQGLLPEGHVRVLSSFLRRNTRSWLDSAVPRAPYVRAATTLAFRKYQARMTRGRKREFYTREVERLRREISQLLSRRAA
jgi:RsiW-degrading membrane proteinase PrsW (M82 family)